MIKTDDINGKLVGTGSIIITASGECLHRVGMMRISDCLSHDIHQSPVSAEGSPQQHVIYVLYFLVPDIL